MKADNHYELAFEAFLRVRDVAALPIVEARRSYLDDDSVKSPDFLVISAADARLVVDVKGRKFGGSPERPRRNWKNWCLRDDVASLERWGTHFGSGFRGVLAFVYHLAPEISLAPGTPDAFAFRDEPISSGASKSPTTGGHADVQPAVGYGPLADREIPRDRKPFSHFLSPSRVQSKRFTAENAEFAEK